MMNIQIKQSPADVSLSCWRSAWKCGKLFAVLIFFSIGATAYAAPEIGLEQPGETELLDGSGVVNLFTLELGDSRTKTITIHNDGTTALTVGTVSVTGADSADFSAGTPVLTTVPAFG